MRAPGSAAPGGTVVYRVPSSRARAWSGSRTAGRGSRIIPWIGRQSAAVLLAVLVGEPSLHAQDLRTVTGRVVEATGGAPLAGATVAWLAQTEPTAAVSDGSGGFTLRIPRDTVLLVVSRPGFAHDTVAVKPDDRTLVLRLRQAPFEFDPLTVTAERNFSAASSTSIRDLDIRLRPRESSHELLRLAAGVAIAQHGGGGKPEQIFLRGFDADHGTDVAITVDGTPVNMVSHGHGQGYADLHFLLPEVVERVDIRKGPFAPQDGDLATAGALALRTRDRLTHGVAGMRAGSLGRRRIFVAVPFGGDATGSGGYVAAAGHVSDGPFEFPDRHRRVNVFGKWTAPLAPATDAFASASGYVAEWNASGQIPERAVREGRIARFGAIDPSEGGASRRHEVSAGLRSGPGANAEWEARLYAVRYDMQLFSNFTFFLADSVRGDGIEQLDDRYQGGLQATYARTSSLLGRHARWATGAGSRVDRADIALYHQDQRQRIAPRVLSRIAQGNSFAWAAYDVELSPRAHLQLGLRGDLFRFGVSDLLAGTESTFAQASGVRWHGIVSPKANFAYRLSEGTTLFANVANGFHSNHARDVILADPTDEVLPRATAAELGSRHTWRGGSAAVAFWATDFESEARVRARRRSD
jgi:outer membrane receptor protein involved in Fe transport